MRRILRHRPSPALVVACLALTIALGGTSYAAVTLPRNSVGTPQLKKNAVNASKVKNFSLLRVDFKRGQIPAGDRGPTGATGATGCGRHTGCHRTRRTVSGNASGRPDCPRLVLRRRFSLGRVRSGRD